ncbi:tryptophan synthase subunit beta [Metabacillus iocasae]|uniref:Tryptophan synthase beta chain n=1 Tax=Priestia iocasae TaxID=2291674 RepID=A0ABS2QQJ9_9BACI|nr:tryptophan synthase subunit beta [Metabacillus iocasae]MBM7701730.1 tryptophan synthase beta subunit [Metabacillus iocasae]
MTYSKPDQFGRFGEFGGKYVPETLMNPLEEVEKALADAMNDPAFKEEYMTLLKEYSGRPTALTYAENVTNRFGGAKIYLKREDLNHTGAHKINNAIGQALLAKRMGKTKLIAETGAGQHGVATATVAAKFGMECKVFMGEEDIERQALNVFRMKLLGAEVIPATSGTKTLKDATNEAIRYWVQHCEDHFYLIGSAIGPHPYPKMVRDFQKIIGEEAKQQFLKVESKLPTSVVACVGGGSNAIGMFYDFIKEDNVQLVGVEAGGKGLETNLHAAKMAKGTKGVIHGTLTYLMQDENGQITEPYSISAGLDYPGIGPEHSHLATIGRVTYKSVTDYEAIDALQILAQEEGIIPAIESAHALAEAYKMAARMTKEETILVCLSGRGDKDVQSLITLLEGENDNEQYVSETLTTS